MSNEKDQTREDVANAIDAVGAGLATALAGLHPVVGPALGFASRLASGLVRTLGVSEGLKVLEQAAKNPLPFIDQAALDAQTEDVIAELEGQG